MIALHCVMAHNLIIMAMQFFGIKLTASLFYIHLFDRLLMGVLALKR